MVMLESQKFPHSLPEVSNLPSSSLLVPLGLLIPWCYGCRFPCCCRYRNQGHRDWPFFYWVVRDMCATCAVNSELPPVVRHFHSPVLSPGGGAGVVSFSLLPRLGGWLESHQAAGTALAVPSVPATLCERPSPPTFRCTGVWISQEY